MGWERVNMSVSERQVQQIRSDWTPLLNNPSEVNADGCESRYVNYEGTYRALIRFKWRWYQKS